MPTNPYSQGLGRRPANYVALTPLAFLERSARVYPRRTAIVHGARRQTWAETYARCRRLGSALARRGIGRGDTVAVMLANTPEMIEAHFGVPMAGARAQFAQHAPRRRDRSPSCSSYGEAQVLITDREFAPVVRQALRRLARQPLVIDVDDPEYAGPGERLGAHDYEALLAAGDPEFEWLRPADEWDAISLNYTSGTTGDPKGVVYHHRGAYLNALCNLLDLGHAAARGVPVDAADVPLQRLVLPVDAWRRTPASTSACARSTRRRSSS